MFYCLYMIITLSFNMIQDTAQVRGHNLSYTVNTVADVFLYTSAMFSVRIHLCCQIVSTLTLFIVWQGIMPTLMIVLIGLGSDSSKVVVGTYDTRGKQLEQRDAELTVSGSSLFGLVVLCSWCRVSLSEIGVHPRTTRLNHIGNHYNIARVADADAGGG
jgi:hypothetical protein